MPQKTCYKHHGGKSYQTGEIVPLLEMVPHTRFVDAYFGGGSVLHAKSCEGIAEFANDIDWQLTNFWKVLQDERDFTKFQRIVEAIPVSVKEWQAACGEGYDFVEARIAEAVRFFVRKRQSRQGLERDYCTPTSRLRRGMNENVSAWLSAVEHLPWFHRRMIRVEVRQQPALTLIDELDSPETLFYLDPPYMHETRSTKTEYGRYEMTKADHKALLIRLSKLEGKFLLSGYDSKLYANAMAAFKWHCVRHEIVNQASSGKTKEKKVECLWANYPIAL